MTTAKVNFILLFLCVIFSCSDNHLTNNPSYDQSFLTKSDINTITSIEGTQPGGALYKIDMPDIWNKELVIFAHGYVPENEPLQIPQLMINDTTSLSAFFTKMNYAFASTSYRKNGLAIKEGIEDLSELLTVVRNQVGRISNVYLIGFAEGGLVTVLSMEKNFFLYNGALSVSSPAGDFKEQINYISNFRLLFDYYYPDVIPGSVIDVPAEVAQNFDELYAWPVLKAVRHRPELLDNILRILDIPNKNRHHKKSRNNVFLDILRYHAIITENMQFVLGGQPFDNSQTEYNFNRHYKKHYKYRIKDKINFRIPRYTADQVAIDEINNNYQTSGRIFKPMVMIHSKYDPVIPPEQLELYKAKTVAEGTDALLATDIFGHRKRHGLSEEDLKKAFDTLVLKVTGKLPGEETDETEINL